MSEPRSPMLKARDRLARALGRGRRRARPEAEPGLVSYSQQGEDLILHCLFQNFRAGFYVDVGAHHPSRFSNTYFFYLRGWRGINIDAMPGSMDAFRRARPGDINLESGVAEAEGRLSYYRFDEPAVNGFSRELSESRAAEGHFRLVGTEVVPARPLATILAEHLPPGRAIDFLSVDAEGMDLEVLRSNDWSRFRPKVVVAEDIDALMVDGLGRSPIVEYLGGLGYRPIAKSIHSFLMADESRLVSRPDRFFDEGGPAGLAGP